MNSAVVPMLNFLQPPQQFSIPIFQRRYSWTEKDCQQLLDDILRVGDNDEIDSHFLGSIVYIRKEVAPIGSIPKFLVIDGQQRLTTLSLLLSALSLAIMEGDDDIGTSRRVFKITIFSTIRKRKNCAINYFSLKMIKKHSLIC